MTWFKVDDKFPRHRKVRKVKRSNPDKRRDAAPFGLWVLAGAESDDGFIPLEVLEEHDDDAEDYADRLVAAGLWIEEERDGEPGYRFHDWADHNPADASSSGTFGNHVKWHQKRGEINPDCPHCVAQISGRSRGDDRGDIGSEIAPESLPDPTRPVPTRPEPKENPSRSRSTKKPEGTDRFDEFWETYGKKVDRKGAEAKWRLALKKPDVTAELLIAAAAAYVLHERTHNEGGRYIMGPAKWLLNERWRDERPARPAPQSRVQQHLQLARDLQAEEQGQMIPFPQIGGDR